MRTPAKAAGRLHKLRIVVVVDRGEGGRRVSRAQPTEAPFSRRMFNRQDFVARFAVDQPIHHAPVEQRSESAREGQAT